MEAKNLAIPIQRWMYFSGSWQFVVACSEEATRLCKSLGECAGADVQMIADAYLMGGEL